MSHNDLPKPASLPDDVRDMAAMLFEFTETEINRADTKAGLILAADTLFATTVTVLSKGVVVNLLDDALPPLARAVALLTILMFAAILTSATFALIVARPILRLPNRERTIFFFGKIAEMRAPDFITAFSTQSTAEMKERLLNEVFTISLISYRKFVRVQRSLDCLITALMLWALIQVLTAMVR